MVKSLLIFAMLAAPLYAQPTGLSSDEPVKPYPPGYEPPLSPPLPRAGSLDPLPQGPVGSPSHRDARKTAQARDAAEAERLIQEAGVLNLRDDFRRAFDRVERAIDLAPDYWRVYWTRGIVTNRYTTHMARRIGRSERIDSHRRALRDHQKASMLYEKQFGEPSLRVSLDEAREWINLGRFAGDRFAYGRALEILQDETTIKNAGRQFAYILALRGSLKIDSGDLEGALADLNEAIRLSPSAKDYFRSRAYVLQRMGRTSQSYLDKRFEDELHDEQHRH